MTTNNTKSTQNYDVVEVSDDNYGYDDPADLGKLAVQRNAEWIGFAADLDEAAAMIAADCGVDVEDIRLKSTHNYFSGQRWEVKA